MATGNRHDPLVELAKQLTQAEAELVAAQAKFDAARKALADVTGDGRGGEERARNANGHFQTTATKTIKERVLDYLRRNPDKRAVEAVNALGENDNSVRSAIFELKRDGHIQKNEKTGGYSIVSTL